MNLDHTRSNNDQKEYRLVTLESGLEVLLVSTEHLAEGKGLDLRDGKAAAAMCVQVGSFADPAEAEGLAHFLEHMVFMGSAKYPSENGFVIVRGLMIFMCLEDYYSIQLLSYFLSSDALRSSDLLVSYSVITLALHNTIILIITIPKNH